MLLVPGPHFEKHLAQKHSQTQGGCMLSHSINHTPICQPRKPLAVGGSEEALWKSLHLCEL